MPLKVLEVFELFESNRIELRVPIKFESFYYGKNILKIYSSLSKKTQKTVMTLTLIFWLTSKTGIMSYIFLERRRTNLQNEIK